ncbi:hypothetical protein RRG08_024526 [Elysia crispata]|uniref:Reverse transcriptase domain-containing protein n=1 Tax=Elysia crispata TaxID=231223 RepID=A0AAE0Y7R5_9GAST|nr:hypothetical protein RRG08_024526 [Elysia crispata]
MRFSTNSYTTDWVNLEIRIAMGCTISPILFVMAMEVIFKAAEDNAGPANLGGGCYLPPLKAFMDDTTIICSNVVETRRMLERLDVLMAWCRMKFKPKKSRSLSVRKGRINATTVIAADTNGLGSSTAKWWSKAEGKEKRDMVINEIRLNEDSRRVQKAVQQPQQGHRTNWDNALQKSLNWNEIWHMAPLRISFLIR